LLPLHYPPQPGTMQSTPALTRSRTAATLKQLPKPCPNTEEAAVSAHRYPPGPKDWLPFRLYREYSRDTLGLLLRLAREYGDIVHVRAFFQHLVLLSHPDLIQQVLVVLHRTTDKANVKIRFLMPESLSAVTGERHRQLRHLLQPYAQRNYVG